MNRLFLINIKKNFKFASNIIYKIFRLFKVFFGKKDCKFWLYNISCIFVFLLVFI